MCILKREEEKMKALLLFLMLVTAGLVAAMLFTRCFCQYAINLWFHKAKFWKRFD